MASGEWFISRNVAAPQLQSMNDDEAQKVRQIAPINGGGDDVTEIYCVAMPNSAAEYRSLSAWLQ